MKKLARYLKPYTGWILLCVALLFAQAMCELNLPNLMSDIVNVGLQQSGIEDEAPRVLSQEGLKLLSPFVDESDRSALEAGYTTVSYTHLVLVTVFSAMCPGEGHGH